MKVSHIQSIFSKEHGGPTHSLSNYCNELAKRGHQIRIWALEGWPGVSPAIRLESPVESAIFPVEFPSFLGRSSRMYRSLQNAPLPDILHLHGVWHRAMCYGAVLAQRKSVPYLVELMGAFEPYGLRHHWIRKKVARLWYQDRVLSKAACLHVNSLQEAKQLRQLGFTVPIAIIPVGVDFPAVNFKQGSLGLEDPWPELGSKRFFLYMSRIHSKKGIELLLSAWARIAALHDDTMLMICGSGESEYVSQCKVIASQLGVSRKCLWTGYVDEAQKRWALSHASFFVLPSFSENFGNIIAESFAHRTPVITTSQTPWVQLNEKKCGWVIEPNIPSLSEVLNEALSKSSADLQEMGLKGHDWCLKEFSLSATVTGLEQVYAWMLGRCAIPDVVWR